MSNPYHDPVADFLTDFRNGLTIKEAAAINGLTRQIAEGVLRLALKKTRR